MEAMPCLPADRAPRVLMHAPVSTRTLLAWTSDATSSGHAYPTIGMPSQCRDLGPLRPISWPWRTGSRPAALKPWRWNRPACTGFRSMNCSKHGLRVYLVNAHHLKHVPGRKSDVKDCQWIQYLHTCGLLNGSFRPEEASHNKLDVL